MSQNTASVIYPQNADVTGIGISDRVTFVGQPPG